MMSEKDRRRREFEKHYEAYYQAQIVSDCIKKHGDEEYAQTLARAHPNVSSQIEALRSASDHAKRKWLDTVANEGYTAGLDKDYAFGREAGRLTGLYEEKRKLPSQVEEDFIGLSTSISTLMLERIGLRQRKPKHDPTP